MQRVLAALQTSGLGIPAGQQLSCMLRTTHDISCSSVTAYLGAWSSLKWSKTGPTDMTRLCQHLVTGLRRLKKAIEVVPLNSEPVLIGAD